MSDLRLHDTLTGKLTPFEPRRPGEAAVYCCGPTTYDVAHVGHARAALAPDILVRHLRAKGLRVTYARNITDVDDKILKRAGEAGEPPMELSARMARLYQEDIAALGCLTPDVQPKVSEHIAEIIALIETLIARGAAYAVDMPNGAKDVYYAVRSFPAYGKLSKRQLDDLQVGARIEASEDKRDPLDFALWKGSPGESWGWDSPWGKGRPGWHIECSAMSERYLGFGFDVHAGGMDLIFPHHENEIAQSEAAHAGEGNFARYWIHNGFVNVDREKMSKSLGNFVTIRQAYERNDPEALRYFLLGVHYRGPISFDLENRCPSCGAARADAKAPCAGCGSAAPARVIFPGIIEAERRVDYLYGVIGRLQGLSAQASGDLPAKLPKELQNFAKLAAEARGRVAAALDDDLNTPVALAILGEIAKAGNELGDLAQKRRKDAELVRAAAFVAKKLLAALEASAEVLGLLRASPEAYRARTQAQRLAILGLTPAAIEARVAERKAARDAKDFARSDAIRKELDALGIEVADATEGTTWRVGI